MLCGILSAQTPLKTYTASDVNQNNTVDVEDVTQVVNSTMGKAAESNVVDAAELNEVLQNIYQLLGKLENLETKVSEIEGRLRYVMQDLDIVGPFPDVNGIVSNGHEYVDLGLKDNKGRTVYWATCNIGAENAEDYGQYFAWGETKGYYRWESHTFDFAHYKWMEEGCSTWQHITKYTVDDDRYSGIWYHNRDFEGDNLRTLLPEDDAAHVNWGGDWHMPTGEECNLLFNKCSWTWDNSKNGYIIEGPNGNTIFLPGAGYWDGETPGTRIFGSYWTQYIRETSLGGIMYFESYRHRSEPEDEEYRCCGLPIRAVCVSPE